MSNTTERGVVFQREKIESLKIIHKDANIDHLELTKYFWPFL